MVVEMVPEKVPSLYGKKTNQSGWHSFLNNRPTLTLLLIMKDKVYTQSKNPDLHDYFFITMKRKRTKKR
jgi:hypothetical protein